VRTALALLRARSRQRITEPPWLVSSVRNRTTSLCVSSPPCAAKSASVSVTASADDHATSPAGRDDMTSSRTVASISRAKKSARSI